MGSYLIIFPEANIVDPDRAALTQAARSESALLAISVNKICSGCSKESSH